MSIGQKLTVRFRESEYNGRRGVRAAQKIDGRYSFPDRNGPQPQDGDIWEVEICGQNPNGTVWFLRCLKRVSTQAEREGTDATSVANTDVTFGTMPAFTWKNGELTPGIQVKKVDGRLVIEFGEPGAGRILTHAQVIGINPVIQENEDDDMLSLLDPNHSGPQVVLEAGVAILNEEKKLCALKATEKPEPRAFLVRVNTQRWYRRGTNGVTQVHRGSPTLVTSGKGAHGAAGRVSSWVDELIVLREGDVLYIECEGDKANRQFVLLVENGQLHTEPWRPWEKRDADRFPQQYLANNRVLWKQIPPGWVGEKVDLQTIKTWGVQHDKGILVSRDEPILRMEDGTEQRLYEKIDWVELKK